MLMKEENRIKDKDGGRRKKDSRVTMIMSGAGAIADH
jgi:hypothetical protein